MKAEEQKPLEFNDEQFKLLMRIKNLKFSQPYSHYKQAYFDLCKNKHPKYFSAVMRMLHTLSQLTIREGHCDVKDYLKEETYHLLKL